MEIIVIIIGRVIIWGKTREQGGMVERKKERNFCLVRSFIKENNSIIGEKPRNNRAAVATPPLVEYLRSWRRTFLLLLLFFFFSKE